MIYLLLSVLASTIIFIIFNLFKRYNVVILQAIVINYVIAAAMGFSKVERNIYIETFFEANWFYGAILLGIVFITIFNFMALTSSEWGISVASVASKLSVAIPVTAAIFLYADSVTFLKIVGILLAFIGVFLASIKQVEHRAKGARIWLPVAVFIGSGFIDTFMKYNQEKWLSPQDEPLFLSIIFSVAFMSGIALLTIKRQLLHFQFKSVLWGIALGVPNYFSMEFLLKALQTEGVESSVVFPLNNMGIVLCSSVLAWLFLKEHLSIKNWIGIALSALAIVLIGLS